jgi:hypothetical protein
MGTSRGPGLASLADWGIMEAVQRGDSVPDNGLRGFPIPFQYEWLLALGAAGVLGLIVLTTIVIV